MCLLHIQVIHAHFRRAPLCGLDLRDGILCQLLALVLLEDLQ